ncbi:transposase [Endozoicomonas euniceicola]|uniref:Transposase n=1 Tax=Endozoicomonas euniceicola TaxID=1234143 RepID=A0ABY6GRB4_9GAMM|nr:transposase [Endozoicomonas euniceicola]UYM15292.1 transposase [Endozoicomonas euniceicola]
MRQRETLIRYRASHIQHMQKALRQMNLLLDNVVSDVTGKTGMSIIRSILRGERDPVVLASHRDSHCKQSEKVIAKSLHGHYRAEHLFALKQAVELYDFYEKEIEACDKALENQLSQFDDQVESASLPAKRKSASAPGFDVRAHLYRMTGVDLTAIEGIEENTALKVISETGTDMNRWPTEKHFCSWLGLSPGNKISGGKVLSSKTKRIPNRAASALRMAALTLVNSKSALGAYYRRMRSKLGAPKAIGCGSFATTLYPSKTNYFDDREQRKKGCFVVI